MSYATLAQTRLEQTTRPDEHTSTATDAHVVGNNRSMTERIDLLTPGDLGFEPYLQTQYYSFDGYEMHLSMGKLFLDAPLLEAVTVTDSDGTVLTEWDGTAGNLAAADFRVANRNETPYTALQRLSGGDKVLWNSPTSGASQITVEGYFGYRRRYTTDGWLDSTDALAAAITSATALTFTVADADGADGFNITPRFSPGQLIRIDSEFMRVISVSTNTISVLRGQNGTTADTHLISTQIDTWYPDRNIVRICARGAAYMSFRAGRYDTATFDGVGTTAFPANMLKEVEEVLMQYPNLSIPGGIGA